ncbi:MAG: hypothetical protein JW940_33195 [Polyangiaceae bacterium]|nr:hypothetical protein [Polyangiaceae bacterium]
MLFRPSGWCNGAEDRVGLLTAAADAHHPCGAVVPERLTLVGQASWVCVYALAVWIGARDRVSAIPVAAILLNLSWEFLFAFWRPPASRATRVLYWSWLILDLVLLVEVLWWGAAAEPNGFIRDHHATLVLGALGLLVGLQWLVYRAFGQKELQAYVVNLIMSALFIQMYFARHGQGLSLSIAWLKFLGTGAISVANVSGWIRERRVFRGGLAIMVAVALLDALYVALLYR